MPLLPNLNVVEGCLRGIKDTEKQQLPAFWKRGTEKLMGVFFVQYRKWQCVGGLGKQRRRKNVIFASYKECSGHGEERDTRAILAG